VETFKRPHSASNWSELSGRDELDAAFAEPRRPDYSGRAIVLNLCASGMGCTYFFLEQPGSLKLPMRVCHGAVLTPMIPLTW